jgi:MFS family permease
MAPTWPIFLFGRGLQGLGGGSLGAVAYISVSRGYPERLRPRLLALLASAWIVPALVGPAIAGQVAEHASWRFVFLGIVPLVAVGAVLLVSALRRLADQSPSSVPLDRRRMIAAVQLAAGVGLVLWAVGLSELGPDLLVGVLGAGLAAPALRSLMPAGTFTGGRGMPAAVAIRGLLAFGFFGAEAAVPLGLATVRGLPPSLVGLALTAAALAWVSGSWLQDRDEARTSGSKRRRALRVRTGLVLVLVGIVGVGIVILMPSLPVPLGVLAWSIGGLGMGLAYPGCTLVALGGSSEQAGVAAASLQIAETIGIAAGAGAVGALIGLGTHLEVGLSLGLAAAFGLMSAALALSLAPAFRLVPAAADSSEPPAMRDPSAEAATTSA